MNDAEFRGFVNDLMADVKEFTKEPVKAAPRLQQILTERIRELIDATEPNRKLATVLEDMDLTVASYRILKRHSIHTAGALIATYSRERLETELFAGRKPEDLQSIINGLIKLGLKLR